MDIVVLGVICNYFGGSPLKVILVLLTLGLAVALIFTFITIKKVLVSWTKYIAFFGLIMHAILITYVHQSLNSVFLLFFDLIFMSLFLNISLIAFTYAANLIMIFSFYYIYGQARGLAFIDALSGSTYDSSLETYTVIGSHGSIAYPYKGTWSMDVTDQTTYRYVRVIKTVSEYFYIGELRVFGN